MNVLEFQKMKDEGRKISMVTCYDYSSARAVAASSIDCILVGDSVAMTARVFQYSFGYRAHDGLAHRRRGPRCSVQVHRRRLAVSLLPQRIEGR
jgi:ketopantoate hydroxymethyltransferase